MPSFFNFQQGNENRGPTHDSSPLLGRFRAVPDAQRHGSRSHRNSLLGTWTGRGSGWGYGTVLGADDDDSDILENEDMGRLKRWGRTQRDLWLEPKQAVVARLVDKWWSRWALLAVLPAALVCYKCYKRLHTLCRRRSKGNGLTVCRLLHGVHFQYLNTK